MVPRSARRCRPSLSTHRNSQRLACDRGSMRAVLSRSRSTVRFRPFSQALGAIGLLLIVSASGARATESVKAPDAPKPEKTASAAEKKPADKAEPEKEKTIDETVKEYQKLTGLFTFYRKKKGTSDTLMMEVPKDRLDQ